MPFSGLFSSALDRPELPEMGVVQTLGVWNERRAWLARTTNVGTLPLR